MGHLVRIVHTRGTITIHYIDSDYVLCSHLLETKEITQAYTGMNIAEEIRGIINKWGLSLDQVSGVTTDNGMVLAMNGQGFHVFHIAYN